LAARGMVSDGPEYEIDIPYTMSECSVGMIMDMRNYACEKRFRKRAGPRGRSPSACSGIFKPEEDSRMPLCLISPLILGVLLFFGYSRWTLGRYSKERASKSSKLWCKERFMHGVD
jgi:hypothetical protein